MALTRQQLFFIADTFTKRPGHCGETLAISEHHSLHLRPDTILPTHPLFSPVPFPSMCRSSATPASLLLVQLLLVGELVVITLNN